MTQFTCDMQVEISIFTDYVRWVAIIQYGQVYARIIIRGPEDEWHMKIEDMLQRLNNEIPEI